MSPAIDETRATEVLVIGSGTAGVCAAIQAARLGCQTILVEKDDVLGGNSGPNLGVHISGADCYHPFASETGIIGELEEEAAWRDAKIHTPDLHYNISRQWETIMQEKLEEAGVSILKRHCARQPIIEGRRIAAVIVEDNATFKTKRIDVSVCVIEASGDGHVAAQAGASFMMGRDARGQFGEPGAPEEADKLTMGTSLTCLAHRTDHPVRFIPPHGVKEADLHERPVSPLTGDLRMLWPVEHGGQAHLSTLDNDHEIYEGLLKQLYAYWHHLKNGPQAEEMQNWELVWISPKAGKRESRRFVGDYVLTQMDVLEGRDFPDSVAYGGYDVDVHEPQADGTSKVQSYGVPPLYGIPYRCLYSKDFDNLLLAGRLVSVTRIAMGTVRLMKTGGAVGQAAGVAAWLCKKDRCSTRGVHTKRVEELQQTLLRNDATILRLRNQDERDRASRATVTASSEETFESTRLDDFLPLDGQRGVFLFDWPERTKKIQLYLRNTNDEKKSATLRLMGHRAPALFGRDTDKKGRWAGIIVRHMASLKLQQFEQSGMCSAELRARFEGWVEFCFSPPVDLSARDPRCVEPKCLVLLDPCPGMAWGLEKRPADFAARVKVHDDGQLEAVEERHLLKIEPRPPHGEARNVINGFNRRFGRCPVNMWISEHGQALPQWIELDLGRPAKIRRIHVTFDGLYEHYRLMPYNCDKRVSEMLVKDYALLVFVDGQWRTVVEERNNYRRFRVHSISPVEGQRVRLEVRAVHDPERWTARVYEIRLY